MNDFGNFIDHFWSQGDDLSYVKQRITDQFDQIFLELNHQPANILVLGYHNAVKQSFVERGLTLDSTVDHSKKYDTVIALDEYFTYCETEDSQRQNIATVLDSLDTGGIVLTSMRDYRNNPVHKRTVGDTSFVTIDKQAQVIVETNKPNSYDKQSWTQKNYVINTETGNTKTYSVGNRRTLYFKQLAKYCNDAGCQQFGILKDNFWKNPIRKSMEHIAWTRYSK